MPPGMVDRDDIQRRIAAGETQRQVATALGITRWDVWHLLHAEAPEPEPRPAPAPTPPAPEPEPEPEPEPFSAAQAMEYLQTFAESVKKQAHEAYAPWHTLKLVIDLSDIVVAVIKELRHHANHPDPDTRGSEITRGV